MTAIGSETPNGESDILQKLAETLSDVWFKISKVEEALSDIKRLPVAAARGDLTAAKDFYTTEEFAAIAELLPDTVTTYCRLGKLNATKTVVGRGTTGEWRLSHAERLRYEKEGLLREDRPRRRPPRRF